MADTPVGTLTEADLVRETGTSADTIRRLVAIGVVAPDDSEKFTRSDVQRVQVALAYEASGIGLEHLEQHIREQRMTFAYVDRIYPEPSPRSGRTVADLEDELEMPGVVAQLYLALGLVRPGPDHELSVADDELLRAFIAAWQPSRDWPETMFRAARLVGDAMRRAVEGWVALFAEKVALPVEQRAEMTIGELAPLVMEPGARLAQLVHPTAIWLADRHLERALNAMNVETMEAELEARGLKARTEVEMPAVVFADLSGFTSLTEEQGDEAAAGHAAHLSFLGARVALDAGGRLVKELGDGIMLVFPSASAATSAALAIQREATEDGLPAVHIGIGAGPLVGRDGDYFGRTVNMASRLSGAAAGGEILLEGAAAARIPPGTTAIPLGPRALKGMHEPIAVYRLAVDSPQDRP